MSMGGAMWVYVDGGTERGWFSDEERAEMDSVRTPEATYTWREVTAEEREEFDRYVSRLYREQN